MPLDQPVGAPRTGDPRIHLRPATCNGMTFIPLSRPGGIQAHKLLIPPRPGTEPQPQTHEGFEWIYVLAGRLRLLLGDQNLILAPGEAAEFDTHGPHWLGPDGDQPVELLVLFGRQVERAHLKAPHHLTREFLTARPRTNPGRAHRRPAHAVTPRPPAGHRTHLRPRPGTLRQPWRQPSTNPCGSPRPR